MELSKWLRGILFEPPIEERPFIVMNEEHDIFAGKEYMKGKKVNSSFVNMSHFKEEEDIIQRVSESLGITTDEVRQQLEKNRGEKIYYTLPTQPTK